LQRLLDQREQQVFLAAEVMVQAPFLQAHSVGQVLHGRGVVALGVEQRRRRLQDLLPAVGATAVAGPPGVRQRVHPRPYRADTARSNSSSTCSKYRTASTMG